MTHNEWIDQAEEWERKAQEAYESGDESRGEMCEAKARACRIAADYGTE